MLCGGFVGCSNNEDGSEANGIVGTWEDSSFAYIFNSNGSGYLRMDYTHIDLGIKKANYKWKKTSTMLHLTFDGSGDIGAGTQSYYYTIEDDILSLWYEDGDFKGAYVKQ